MKTALIIIALFVVPGVIMGLISSYRAGQKPIGDLYLRFKNFAQHRLGDLAVNLVLAVLLVIAMLMVLQWSLNLYHGVY